MNKKQFEKILNSVDAFKKDDNTIDYEYIILLLENEAMEKGYKLADQLLKAEYDIMKGGV